MRTSTLISGPAKRRPRAGCASGSCWPWTLENGLTANYAALGPATLTHGPAAHWPAWLSMKLRPRLLSCGARWWSGINRPRPSLRRNHAPLRNDRLTRRRLRRSCRRSGRSWRFCSHRRCGFACRSGGRRSFRSRRCNNRRWRLRLSRRRCNDHGWRRCGLFNFFLDWRSRWWRDNRRRLARRGHNHWTLSSRSRRLGGRGLFRHWRLRCHGGRGLCLRSRLSRSRRFHHGRRPRRWRGMLEFLLPLSQQLCNVARLGNFGEIDLRPDL
jgi:hypothetical protein